MDGLKVGGNFTYYVSYFAFDFLQAKRLQVSGIMMAVLGSLSTAVILASIASGQFVQPPSDLISTTGYLDLPVRYKEVPDGICELTPGVKSYSGYVDIEENQVSGTEFTALEMR